LSTLALRGVYPERSEGLRTSFGRSAGSWRQLTCRKMPLCRPPSACGFAARYTLKYMIHWLSRTACAWKKHLDGGLPSHSLEKNPLPKGKFWAGAKFAFWHQRTISQ